MAEERGFEKIHIEDKAPTVLTPAEALNEIMNEIDRVKILLEYLINRIIKLDAANSGRKYEEVDEIDDEQGGHDLCSEIADEIEYSRSHELGNLLGMVKSNLIFLRHRPDSFDSAIFDDLIQEVRCRLEDLEKNPWWLGNHQHRISQIPPEPNK